MRRDSAHEAERNREAAPVSILKGLVAGAVMGLFLGILLSSSVWLEMRVRLGRLIPLSMICISLVSLKWPLFNRLRVLLALEVLVLVALFAIHGFRDGALFVVPAALFREGFGLNFLSLGMCNLIWGLSLVGVNSAWVAFSARSSLRQSSRKSGCY
jgi:hypothetical protein